MALKELDCRDPDDLADWREGLLSAYEADESGPTVYLREIDETLFRLVSNRLTSEELKTQLQDWIRGEPNRVNVFATAFARYRLNDIYRCILIWQSRTSPFQEIQSIFPPEIFSLFMDHLYVGQPVNWRDFANFHPEKRHILSARQQGADPGLTNWRK